MDTEPDDQPTPPPQQGTDPALDEAMKAPAPDPQKVIDGIAGEKKEEKK